MQARLRVEGLKEAIRRVDDVGDRGRRPEPALAHPETKFDLQLSEQRKFSTGRFRRDTPAWIQEKRRQGWDARTMRKTGRLESALVNATDGVTMTVRPGGLTWGVTRGRSPIYYAQPLAAGYRAAGRRGRKSSAETTGKGEKGPTQVAARRMVVIDRIARDRISQRVAGYIVDGLL